MSFATPLRLSLAVLLACAAHAAPGNAACRPDGWDGAQLKELKAGQFVIEGDSRRQALALSLVACLSDADPAMRDGIAFEAYSTWLRAGKLDVATRLALFDRLLPGLAPAAADSQGFRQPFTALVLAEIARADRKAPFLSAAQRQQLLDAATGYLVALRDYRGFDNVQGWRHGVAHTADLLMQMALNESLTRPQLDQILDAVKTQVAPAGEHFYIYGEPARLARPVLYTVLRGLHGNEEISAWFQQLALPAPLAAWDQAFRSNAGLARRHNTRAFLLEVYSEVRDSKDTRLSALVPAVTAALAEVP